MRKATLIIFLLSSFGVSPLRADNPVTMLPGMPAAQVLPQAVVSDLTNYPNPFDSRKTGLEGQTQISYSLAQDANVSVEIYGLMGHRVRQWDFAAGSQGGRQGANLIAWDGTNESGRKVSKGGYLAQITIETPDSAVTAVRKIGVIH